MSDRSLRVVQAVEPLVSRQELAEIIGCCENTITAFCQEGMPAIRWGRKLVRFRASEAIAWLAEQDRKAA